MCQFEPECSDVELGVCWSSLGEGTTPVCAALAGVKSGKLSLAQELVGFPSTFLLAIHTEQAE